jgi:RNA polymerase sigma-70 factor (ECF subfamily)
VNDFRSRLESERPYLLRYASLQLRDSSLAEDAVQETLVAALEGLEGFSGQSSLSTWLFGILKHKIADGLRRGPREEPLEVELDELLHEGPGPEQSCASRGALALVERSLERLPAKASRAFVLREVIGLSTEEVCRALEVSPAHCWVLVHRARRRLRACPEVGLLAAEALS